VRLTSPIGHEAVGLAWVSPSVGMWFALDLVTSHPGETLKTWRLGETRHSLAAITLDADGSGRIIAVWEGRNRDPFPQPVTLEVTAQRGFWPFVTESLVLSGTASPATSRQ
jgi:hypothetical protein